jgi:hypothetical protein
VVSSLKKTARGGRNTDGKCDEDRLPTGDCDEKKEGDEDFLKEVI